MEKYKIEESVEKKLEEELDAFEKREGLKSSLFEEELVNRGYPVDRLSFDTLVTTIKGKTVLFKDMNGPFSSAALNIVVDDKNMTRQFVRNTGITAPATKFLRIFQKQQIREFANEVGYPVVLKPNNLARGEGVFMNVDSDESLKKHLIKISNIVGDDNQLILIEKQFNGEDFRFVVVDGEVIAVSQRARANVVGDGESTILELIEQKNELRKQDRDLMNFLIPTDTDKLNRLSSKGHTLQSIPAEGEKVILRNESNISSGGEGIDFTDTVHPHFKELAIKAVQSIPGLHYAGVDMIVEDITGKPNENNHVVTEVEFSPGPVSMFPWKGEVRDMCGPVLDFYERNIDRLP
ncbi:hypothetical protein GCM10008929_03110 [Alkalibacterium psychrotolerans]